MHLVTRIGARVGAWIDAIRGHGAGEGARPVAIAGRVNPSHHIHGHPESAPAPARMRLSLTIVRLLGAHCPLCQGIGCGECPESGSPA